MLSKKTIQHINKLQQKKYRREFGEFIVEGIKGVEEAIKTNSEVLLIVIDESKKDNENFKQIVELIDKEEVETEYCSEADINKLKSTETFPGILAVVEKSEYSLDNVIGGPIICLDDIKDPGNLGTIIRTADWFGINNLILSENCVDLYNPKTVRSTMGSIFRVKTFHSNDLEYTLKKLKDKHNYRLIGLTMDGDNLDKLETQKNTVYIFGSESHGIKEKIEKILDKKYTIEGKGEAESLNVAVSAGILMSKIN
jgi:RNA methyltransferase, TrmH family